MSKKVRDDALPPPADHYIYLEQKNADLFSITSFVHYIYTKHVKRNNNKFDIFLHRFWMKKIIEKFGLGKKFKFCSKFYVDPRYSTRFFFYF